jgi:uncharacterized protein
MKPEKSRLKKAVKSVTESISKGSAAVAAKLGKSKTVSASKANGAAASKPAEAKAPAARRARKPAAKNEAPAIPAILLEGDKSPTPPPSGPGQRYALGPSATPEPASRAESAVELPEAYGTRQLLLTARDPHWLYARWDLTREQQKKYNALSADRHLVLRIFVDQVSASPFAQIHVHPESSHWFVHVAEAGAKYIAELGYYKGDGRWTAISTSGATLTPPDTMSEDTSAQFATIPIEVPFSRLLELARKAVHESVPLAEVIIQLRASGHQISESQIAPNKWTPDQERALASIISMDRVRRVWMGSLEITELIRRQLQMEVSSMSAAAFSLPTSPFGAISSFSSVSSPFGAREQRKGFWFNVNAELILYGATEPDAEVSIGGRVIKLRPDGTFSYRFSLPDGQYDLPAVAISSDKTDGRAAELKFGRSTEYRGDVGVHPQDPRLKPPLATSVA